MVGDYLSAHPVTSGTVHTQAATAATWTIPHSFGRRPAVSVYLATGEEVDADVVATPTQVVVTFASPQAGSAILT